MTNPTIAATMCSLADCTAALSPPDVNHLNPPQTKYKRATIMAIIKIVVIRGPTTLLKPSLQIPAKSPTGQAETDAANAGKARDKYAAAVEVRASNFFMY